MLTGSKQSMPNTQPKTLAISVIVPVFNRPDSIIRALDSVINQHQPPDEIIVIDDGSTDQTPAVIRQQYPNITLLEQSHAGVSAARNTGIQQARGDWIALLDSDDEWLPEKLARQSAAIGANPDYRFCHCDELWVRNGVRVNPKKIHQKYGGYIFEHCLPRCVVSPSAVMLRRDLISEFGLFDETLPACEDYDYWLRTCATEPVLYVDEPLLIKYGGHADQLSRHYHSMDEFRIQAMDGILRSDRLSPAQFQSTVNELTRKLHIVLNGLRKRQRHDHINKLMLQYGHYASMATDDSDGQSPD